MTEVFSQPEALAVPDPYYLRAPFCNPEAPHSSAFDIIANFDPTTYLNDPATYGDSLGLDEGIRAAYEHAKVARPVPPDIIPGEIDLTHAHSVNGLITHLIAHAVTGDVRKGTSTTRIIPGPDRDASRVGLLQIDPANAAAHLEVADGLCVNVLRTLVFHYVDRISSRQPPTSGEHMQTALRISQAMLKGQRSKENPIEEQPIALDVAIRASQGDVDSENIRAMDRTHAVAKLKQLLWLVDQQRDERVRRYLLDKVTTLTERAIRSGITEDELTIDTGRDTGLSEETHRPVYDITGFVQLRHLKADGYALMQEQCVSLSLGDIITSIGRSGHDLPAYQQDGRYELPFRFDAGRVRRAGGAITDLSRQQ